MRWNVWIALLGLAVHRATAESYVFSFFRGNGEAGVYLALSDDALNWREVNGGRPVLTPQVGGRLTRDPSICRGPDGRYHVVWTTAWTDKGFGVAHSDDLLAWSEQAFVPVNADEPQARNTWAPEICHDPDTDQFVVWSEGGIMGPWAAAGRLFTDNRTAWAEGPAVIRAGDRWLVYYDKYNKGGYGAVANRVFLTFQPVTVSLPKGIRHGTVLAVDAETARRLAATVKAPE